MEIGERQSNVTWLACRILALTRHIAFVELDYRLCNGRERLFHLLCCDSLPAHALCLAFSLKNGTLRPWDPVSFCIICRLTLTLTQLMYANLVICHNAIRKGKHFGGNKILVDCDGRSSRHQLVIAQSISSTITKGQKMRVGGKFSLFEKKKSYLPFECLFFFLSLILPMSASDA